MNPSESSSAVAPAKSSSKRTLLLSLLAAALGLAGAGYGVYYFLDARYHVETDDAYVNGNVVQITSQVPGTVVSVGADDTEFVTAGKLRLNREVAAREVARAERQLAWTRHRPERRSSLSPPLAIGYWHFPPPFTTPLHGRPELWRL